MAEDVSDFTQFLLRVIKKMNLNSRPGNLYSTVSYHHTTVILQLDCSGEKD